MANTVCSCTQREEFSLFSVYKAEILQGYLIRIKKPKRNQKTTNPFLLPPRLQYSDFKSSPNSYPEGQQFSNGPKEKHYKKTLILLFFFFLP